MILIRNNCNENEVLLKIRTQIKPDYSQSQNTAVCGFYDIFAMSSG